MSGQPPSDPKVSGKQAPKASGQEVEAQSESPSLFERFRARLWGSDTELYKKGWLDTNHECRHSLDFSPRTSMTLLSLGAMTSLAILWRGRGMSGYRYAAYAAGSLPAAAPVAPPAPPPAPPLARRLRTFVVRSAALGLAGTMLLTFALVRAVTVEDEEDEEDPVFQQGLISGSREASVEFSWPMARVFLRASSGSHSHTIQEVELGGATWSVNAALKPLKHVGFYLTHQDGSKEQIAFRIRLLDVSKGGRRELASETHPGNWVISKTPIPVAADGKGTAVKINDLRHVDSLRLEFEALGPVTKHRGAL